MQGKLRQMGKKLRLGKFAAKAKVCGPKGGGQAHGAGSKPLSGLKGKKTGQRKYGVCTSFQRAMCTGKLIQDGGLAALDKGTAHNADDGAESVLGLFYLPGMA